ncbi:uncharacterized protein LOC120199476 [Hibiscus syriacus]|uniref:uncharacterized protein LOC120199476 n=1 Tax=Hibiscus syriacus TaxID=106335 RepID=UPI001921B222|nr:uncharacterized protein LOC120199476 [Hibiscus syriacus]
MAHCCSFLSMYVSIGLMETEILQPCSLRTDRSFFDYSPCSFNSSCLSYIASAIGFPLSMDSFTATKTRPEFVKVCIEIGATDTVPKYIDVILNNGLTVTIVVEVPWLSPYCNFCKVFGHSTKVYKHNTSSSQTSTLVWRKKDLAISSSLAPETVSTDDKQPLNSAAIEVTEHNPCKDIVAGNLLSIDPPSSSILVLKTYFIEEERNLNFIVSDLTVNPSSKDNVAEETAEIPDLLGKNVDSISIPTTGKKGRRRLPKVNKGLTSSANRFDILNSIDEVHPSLDNQDKKPRATTSGVTELIKELKLKKKTHIDKSKSYIV